MPSETVYIPHLNGTVLGSHLHQPWIAESANAAIGVTWRGQPVFTTRAEAFAWLAHARSDTLRLMDFAVARLDAENLTDPDGLRQVWVDWEALTDPDNQIVRSSADAAGPHPSVLNACYNAVHEAAARQWTSPTSGTVTGRDQITDLVHAVWSRTYPLAFRDAQQVLAGQIGPATRLLLTDPDPRQDLDDATRRGLAALTSAADALAGGTLTSVVPAPPWSVHGDAQWVSADPNRGGWRHGVDRVWATALSTAAADGVLTAATDLAIAWNSRHPAGADAAAAPPAQSASELAVTGWLRRTLAETSRTVLGQWMHAAGRRPSEDTQPAPAVQKPDPSPASVPTRPAASRAYPPLATVDASVQPADAPLAVGATAAGPGRAR